MQQQQRGEWVMSVWPDRLLLVVAVTVVLPFALIALGDWLGALPTVPLEPLSRPRARLPALAITAVMTAAIVAARRVVQWLAQADLITQEVSD